ncbi:Acylphosphatase-like domain-containing protein [Dunaliella salina]|uniref:acylphosphatase n=1 Tax=Dunaliella salina TaxID=3046 RepID=A0ABQ7G836_DUNSA|nr:Acylphosphatase-like domain-containing protein [Dunaliella salina]|eukprot:KAF5830769.1 Acylphosphatase-like domain-containing protein [Dunaliella salina]
MEVSCINVHVHGQGVFFRNYTEKQAKSLGLRGYCLNTPRSTVQGELEGPKDKVEKMKHWLRHEGSPQSVIEKVDFTDERDITDYSYPGFEVRR